MGQLMKRDMMRALFIVVVSVLICSVNIGARVFAETAIDLSVDESQDGEKEKAIDIARDLCAREGLAWDDVTIKNHGDGKWSVVVVSVEQGRTGVIEVNAVKGSVISKSFK